MKKLTIEINRCIECPFCAVLADPSPTDWFDDDDQKMLCQKMDNKVIDVALRPYEKKRVEIPSWCPLEEG